MGRWLSLISKIDRCSATEAGCALRPWSVQFLRIQTTDRHRSRRPVI